MKTEVNKNSYLFPKWKNILTIFKREINAYFNSSIAYIFIIVFVLISNGLFTTHFFLINKADMRQFFEILPIILCVFLPAITMRIWAEDRKLNTLELLLTFPIKTIELTLGKFLAAVVFYIITLIATLPVAVMIIVLGHPDIGVIVSGYIGAIFLGSFFIAIGILISGFCNDQIVAFIVSMITCFMFFLAGTEFITVALDSWIPWLGLGSFVKSVFGITQWFSGFIKGVIDIKGVIYFITGTGIFLTLNKFWFEGRLRQRAKVVFSTACVIGGVIFILINVLFSDISVGRFDLTEGKIYTISKATRKILGELKAPVTIKLYISAAEKMPVGMKTLEKDIIAKLEEFKLASSGNLRYKVLHMDVTNLSDNADKKSKKEDTIEQMLLSKGVRPFQVQSIEADEVGVKLVYSGISIAYKEKEEEFIPKVLPQSLYELEYTLISKIYKMTLDEIPLITIMAPYKNKAMDPKVNAILQQLGYNNASKYREDKYKLIPMLLKYEGYRNMRIKLTEQEPIPDKTDVLVILNPEKLNQRQKFEINKYLVNGGSVFMAVQNYDFEYNYDAKKGVKIKSKDIEPQINDLLDNWGLAVDKNFLMDPENAQVISIAGGQSLGPFSISIPVKTPLHMMVSDQQMSKEKSISSRIDALFYVWGSALRLNKDRLKELSLKITELFHSSDKAWTVAYHRGYLTPSDLDGINPVDKGKMPLSVFVEGQFPDAFEGKDIPQWPKPEAEAKSETEKKSVKQEAEQLKGSSKKKKEALSPSPGKLILTGSSTMFSEEFFRTAGHINFFMNSVDALSLTEDLVEIRSKQPIIRSLKKVSKSEKIWWRLFVMFFVPAILCVIGGARIYLRKKAKKTYSLTV